MSKNYLLTRLSIITTCILYFSSIFHSFSQNFSEINWFIGQNGTAVQFNKNDFEANAANNQHPGLGAGGNAMAVNPVTGDILFYTDGVTIYDASGAPMAPGGLTLGGNPGSNQPAVIISDPGDPDNYFVFVNTGTGITSTSIDMNQPGNANNLGQPALGSIVPPSNQDIYTGNINEGMIVVPGSTPEVFYLIVQDVNGDYKVFTIDENGISTPVTYSFPETDITAANFSYNAATGQIAVSPKGSGEDVQILSIDPATGTLSFQETLAGTGSAGGVYDTEWSEDGSKLYISTLGEGMGAGNVYQYDFNEQPPLSAALLPNEVYASYGIKMGPDNKIYHLYQATPGGPFLMGVINDPDSVASLVEYEANIFPGKDFQGKQFPEIHPADSDECTVDFTAPATACQNAPVSFLPTVNPAAVSFSWDFGNGATSNQQSPNVIFEEPGNYTVTLEVECGGGSTATFTQQINITPNELQVNLQDTTMCMLPPFSPALNLEPEVQGEGNYTYTWSNGDGTPSSDPNSPDITEPGFYWVVVTDQSTGCSVYAGATVKVYREENRIANIWYFGNGAGIDFNEEVPEAIPPGPENSLNTPEGTATISDPNGDVLFYTDGVTVWNKQGAVMPNGNDIGGSQNASQSSIIIPFPDDETMFYIFTPSELYGDGSFNLNYSIVDIKEDNGLGDIDASQKGVKLYAPSTERITAIEGGPGYLLLTHDYGNNTFRVYPIGPNGIGAPVLSSIGSVHSTGSAAAGEGYMKFSSGGERIAVALPPNAVEIFDFVDSTMKVTNYKRIEFDAGETPYGIEFSPSGDMLYVSVNNNGNGPSKLYQIALVDEDGEPIEEPVKVEVFSTGETFGALQIGSDGQMYMAVNGASFVYRISALENNHTIDPIPTPQPFDLQGGISGLGLPNFIQSLLQPPGDPTHDVQEGCVDQVTTFIGTPGNADIDKALWVVTNSSGVEVFRSEEFEDEFIFTEEGEYDVVFTVYNHCDPLPDGYYKTGTKYKYDDFDIPAIKLIIEGPPDDPTIPATISICDDAVTLEAAPETATGLTYLWSTGETTRTIQVDHQTFVNVIITNAQGCTSEGETLVFDARPDLDLGADLVYCEGDTAPDLNSFSPGLSHVWTINGVPTNRTNERQPVSTTVPGIFEYIVTVTDEELGGCVAKDTIIITVNAAPTYPTPSVYFPNCITEEGYIHLQNNPDYSYEWRDVQGNILGNEAELNELEAGIYTVTVTDNNTGCEKIESFTVPNETDIVIDLVGSEHGCGDDGEFEFEITDAAFPITYQIFNKTTNTYYNEPETTSSSTFTTSGLAPGEYILEVIGADDCKAYLDGLSIMDNSNTIELELAQSPIHACESEAGNYTFSVLNADPQYNYSWTRDDDTMQGIEITSQESITVSESGFYKITVTDTNPIGIPCPTTEIVEVIFENAHTVNIIEEDNCDGTLTLRAEVNPAGDYRFMWSNGALGESTTVTETGTISVNARNRDSGCIYGSGPYDVNNIEEELLVTLNASPACEGAPFTLFAHSNQTGVNFTYYNPAGEILASTTETELLVSSNQPAGIYYVVAQKGNCNADHRLPVSKLPAEEWTALPEEVTICTLDDNPDANSIELNPGGNFVSYTWRRSDGGSIVGNNPIYRASQAGVYIVTMETEDGCTFMDQTEVKVDCQPAIFGPNAFTPNNDDLNPTFRLHTRYISDFDIKIFNRWGELIFHDNKKEFEWDGTYRGNIVPNGTYPYLIRYRSQLDTNGIQELRGGVTVVR